MCQVMIGHSDQAGAIGAAKDADSLLIPEVKSPGNSTQADVVGHCKEPAALAHMHSVGIALVKQALLHRDSSLS